MIAEDIVLRLHGTRRLIMHAGRLSDPLDPVTKNLAKLTSKKMKTEADHEAIGKSPWMRFRPQEARAVHLQSRRFVEHELARIASEGKRAVVLTHHGASIEAVDPRHQRSIFSAAYASELLPIVDRHRPAAWISGHTRRPMNFRRTGCRMISNPRGYPGEGVAFDPACIVEVSHD
ncbi:hypothetical protein AB8B21_30825 [Tardiphaga sp. 866_E4_N2_1]|uniref:hypothetical protein n=1 Tax=unclassified Tardiphaga TaxID=2631404 RepID=UPI003F2787AD